VPDAELETYVASYTAMISANAPLTVNSVKFIVGETVKDEGQRDMARCADLVARCFASQDYAEGRKAFMEKRKPVFTGS
jgi:1,4-dihydroxy-2-naphthoyl-CoA synthase